MNNYLNNGIMNRTSKIVSGIALLLFGIGWALEVAGVIHDVSFKGWWTIFIIIPCLASFFSYDNKGSSLIGMGIGVLLLLAVRGTIDWNAFWKLVICLIAVVWGAILVMGKKGHFFDSPDRKTVREVKKINLGGRDIRQIDISFGKRIFSFPNETFEGARVEVSFGFIGLDLRDADLLDGAVIDVDCRFGGMEIRVPDGVCVKQAVESSFAGVECRLAAEAKEGQKTVYINGKCSFGGIEIK